MDWREGKIKTLDQSFFSAIVENSTDLISVIDSSGMYKYVGQSVVRLLGFTPEEMLQTNALFYIHPEDLPFVMRALESATAEKSIQINPFRFINKKGEWRWLDCHLANMLHHQSIQGIVTNSKDITEQRNAQLSEEKAQVYYKSLFHDYPEAIILLDATGRIVKANGPFYQLSGYTADEVINAHYYKFIPEDFWTLAGTAIQQVLHGEIRMIETLFIKKNQDFLDLQITGVPILLNGNLECIQCVIKDITAKKKAESQIELLSLVADKTTNGVIITDNHRNIEWVNNSFSTLSGYSYEEAIGKRPGELLHGPLTNSETILQIREKMQKAEPFSVEILNYKKNGEEFWVSMEVNPIFKEPGLLEKFVATQVDITSKKKAELEMRQLTKDLFNHNRDLKQFTYIVSHNLRAPVASALGLANLLTMVDKNDEIFATSLRNLKTSVEQLNTILKDLNVILSIRDNQDAVANETFVVAEVYQQAVANLHDALNNCHGNVTFTLEGDDRLIAKKAYLYSIFYNLLSNAIKYRSPDRLLKIQVTCRNVPGSGTEITVSDNGSGLDLNKIGENIFKLYKRFHRNVDGRGMGLFLVKTHVEALGGHIEVKSQVNKGTTFIINLP
ncbi:PAS domain-containing protein [Adhaeribacter pallidiroseus]|uniref:histidine kinase n=1 Tax=Adhaeribacter pallidiroseus TaxID=2072847 RepID=A0A369QQ48_9BACT|nr:PAS domain-containing sensor histidine kinase [Adhaeribacter pallidiroseus]RDC66432.1 Histidine kinase [Adhaeribacter pallidiroseus]